MHYINRDFLEKIVLQLLRSNPKPVAKEVVDLAIAIQQEFEDRIAAAEQERLEAQRESFFTDDDYYSFSDALKALNVSENKLKRLVSDGSLPAFRAGDSLAFRRSDVKHLQERITG